MEFMKQIWTSIINIFTGGTPFNILTFILAIIGLITSIYYFRKSKKTFLITYTVRTIQLIKDGIEKLKTLAITYNGEQIPNLTISKIALWNNGTEYIDKSIIASKNPIKVKIDNNYDILDAEILYEKNTSNDFKIKIDINKKYIDVDFEYFDIKEGIVLQVYHTGKNSGNITIKGQIKSGKGINRIKPYASSLLLTDISQLVKISNGKFEHIIKKIFGWICIIISVLMIIFSFYYCIIKKELPVIQEDISENKLITVFCLLFGAIVYGNLGYSIIKRRIPKGFDIFNEEFNNETITKNNEPH